MTQPGHEEKYSNFSSKDKERINSLLFDALEIKQFDDKAKGLVRQLLVVGVPVTITDEARSIPLAVAVKQKCPMDVITSLMICDNLESLLQSQNKHKLTPLHEAVLVNNYEALQVMINNLQGDQLPHIEIDHAGREEQIRSCKVVQLDEKSSCYKILNKKNKEGWTALHYAADRGHVDVLHVLLMVEQCHVSMCNKNKTTAFHLATKGGHLSCLQLLFAAAEQRGLLQSFPRVDKSGWNLACHASAQLKGNVKVMEWLLRNMPEHADINHSNKKGYTPLLLACEYQNIEIVKLLIDHDQISELMTVTDDGKTALHLAAIHDSVEIVKMLLEKGFPIDEIDEKGETPLHVAYKKGSHRVQGVLIAEDANQSIKNKEGKLPKDVKYTDLRIPAEIKKRGEEAVKGYIAALRKGKKKMPRCKLVILGEAGVGKTNLLNLLTREKFVPTHEETEGVDISLVTTFDIDTKTWKKSTGGGDDEYRRIAATELASQLKDTKSDNKTSTSPTTESLQQIFHSIVRKYTKLSKPKSFATASHHTRPVGGNIRYYGDHDQTQRMPFSEPLVESEQRMPVRTMELSAKLVEKKDNSANPRPARTQSQVDNATSTPPGTNVASLPSATPSTLSSSTKRTDTGSREPQPSSVPTGTPSSGDQFYTIILRQASREKSSEPLTLRLKLTSFDFAGQKHYRSMHPCFMTSRAVYIVTVNARHLLSEEKCKQCVGEINYWVNSILVHTNKDARVILVGTHRGPYSGADGFEKLTEEEKSYINRQLKNHLKDHSVFSFFEGDRIMALVESSIENNQDASGAKVVRKKLQSLGEFHPSNKDELPLSYLRLESKIFAKRSENKLFLVPRDEVKQWANDSDIEDVNVALDFFHDIGIIINPSCLPNLFLTKEEVEPLQGVILIKPQWLADVMKELMKIDRGKFENMEREVRKEFDCLIETGKAHKEHVLFPLWKEHHNNSEELFEQICLLLEAYGVIIPIKKENYYYISCKLPQKVDTPQITGNCHSFRVDFKNGFFPPFILHQLMFKMYQDNNLSKSEFSESACYMHYIEDCQWWLSQNNYNDAINVTIRTKQYVRTILPAMQLVDRMLEKILKAEELSGICYELGPIGECSQCESVELFSYITYDNKNDRKKQDASTSQTRNHQCLQCSKCQNEVSIKCNPDPETDKIIKSKNYKYGKPFEKFKEDLNYNKLDDELRRQLNEQFLLDLPKHSTTNIGTDDGKVFRQWYKDNKNDPWPMIVGYLSNCEHSTKDFEIDRIKCNFLFLCDHCL